MRLVSDEKGQLVHEICVRRMIKFMRMLLGEKGNVVLMHENVL